MGNDTASWVENAFEAIQQSNVERLEYFLSRAIDMGDDQGLAELENRAKSLDFVSRGFFRYVGRSYSSMVLTPGGRGVYQNTLIGVPVALTSVAACAETEVPIRLDGPCIKEASEALAYAQGILKGQLHMSQTLVKLDWLREQPFMAIRNLVNSLIPGAQESTPSWMEGTFSAAEVGPKTMYVWLGVHRIEGLAEDDPDVKSEMGLMETPPKRNTVFDMHKYRADTYMDMALKKGSGLNAKADVFFVLRIAELISAATGLDIQLKLRAALTNPRLSLQGLNLDRVADKVQLSAIDQANQPVVQVSYDLAQMEVSETNFCQLITKMAQSQQLSLTSTLTD